jgi:Tfp pilus assembly protein PilF
MTNYAQMLGEEAAEGNSGLSIQAHKLLLRAIELKPEYAQAHFILGVWNEAFGTKQAAMDEYKTALTLKPNWPEVRDRLDRLSGRN